jgi:hypothetical protein
LRRGYERGWTWPKKLRNILAADGTNVATEDALGVTGDLENVRRPRLSNEQNRGWIEPGMWIGSRSQLLRSILDAISDISTAG